MNSGVLFLPWRTFGTDASYSLNVVEHKRVERRGWPVRWHNGPDGGCRCCCCCCCCCAAAGASTCEWKSLCMLRRWGGRWRSGRVPSVAPPLLHATGACLLGLNPGVVNTEFRSGLGWCQTGCNRDAAGRKRRLPVCLFASVLHALRVMGSEQLTNMLIIISCSKNACFRPAFHFGAPGWDEFGDRWSSSKANCRAGGDIAKLYCRRKTRDWKRSRWMPKGRISASLLGILQSWACTGTIRCTRLRSSTRRVTAVLTTGVRSPVGSQTSPISHLLSRPLDMYWVFLLQGHSDRSVKLTILC